MSEIPKHSFPKIQLSDREKFHTGMLKLTLDLFQKEAYEGIFGNKFANNLFTSEVKEIETCLEENSVDLSIKKREYVFAIIKTKFKTGLHYSKDKERRVSQLEKYALNNREVKYGFVVSLFSEKDEDLNITSEEKTKIKNFAPLRYTVQVLDYLKANPYLKKEKPLHAAEDRWEKIQKHPATPLITRWKRHLEELGKHIDRFENNEDLKKITFQEDIDVLLSSIKLRGVFDGFLMNQVKTKNFEWYYNEVKKTHDNE